MSTIDDALSKALVLCDAILVPGPNKPVLVKVALELETLVRQAQEEQKKVLPNQWDHLRGEQ